MEKNNWDDGCGTCKYPTSFYEGYGCYAKCTHPAKGDKTVTINDCCIFYKRAEVFQPREI